MTYPVIQVPEMASAQLEQLGTKEKFWFRAADGAWVLFKEGYPGSGEHWAEKVACEVARLLGLPHAEYDLAVWRGRLGVVSPSLVPQEARLILGNELLAKNFPDYAEAGRFRVRQHTVRRVLAVLGATGAGTPSGWTCPTAVADAVGVFVGYLLLDALIGNQDRHHENWGLINSARHGLTLAPTFDHASSLGRNETDEVRIERLTTRDSGRSVRAYAARATSGLYETHTSKKALSTLDAFTHALWANPSAAAYWLECLDGLDSAHFETILNEVPGDFMTQPARDFALRLLSANRDRLLHLPSEALI
ncbi:hypothetical protein [uncultured Thiodictyon sp.]|uniref:hypothetical protein n=1 Tax=uncultured Thiodictyon sp. TaxID=1846217 RepID=UPI0025CEFF29|nr:hypothetical protein [uncultured Thiodictyon sp.]